MLPLVLLLCPAADPIPAFTVENRCAPAPAFVVTNRVKPHAACFNCASCGAACACFGRRYYCSEAAGCSPARPLTLDSPAPSGHEWVKPQGGSWELRKLAAPAVAAPQPFRSGDYWPSHACPQCGRSQFVVSGWAGNGQHFHECAVDHTRWRH
jgi:hypothetical protein